MEKKTINEMDTVIKACFTGSVVSTYDLSFFFCFFWVVRPHSKEHDILGSVVGSPNCAGYRLSGECIW